MKKLILILTFFFALTVFVGCNKEQDKGGELTKNATVNVYSWWDPAHDGLTGLKAGFEKKYEDYNVTLNFVKISSYYQTMLTKLAGAKLAGGSSEQIDVMMLASDKIPLFASNGTILPLDEFVTEEYLNDLYPSVRQGLYYEDKVYAVARDVTTKCMMLNVDLFNKYKITIPGDDWTVEDFKNICLQFAAQPDNVWGYSFDSNPDPVYIWFYLFGGKFFDPVKNESLLNTPGSIAGVKFLYDLIEKDGVMSLSETTEHGGFSASFSGGYAAMISGGLSQVNTVENAGANFVVRPLPIGTSGEKTSHTFLNCWTIPECTSNSAWAWKVLEYFSGPEGQAIACGAGMGLPGSSTADIQSWIAQKPYRKYFVDALSYPGTVPYPTDTFGPNWQTYFKTLMETNFWDAPGLTSSDIETRIVAVNNKLTYYLMGGS